MSNFTGLSPNNPRDYVGPSVALNTVVSRNRAPTGADYRQPETGKLYPFNTYWLVGKDPTTGVQGDLWYLSKIAGNVGYWLMLSAGGSGPLLNVDVDAATVPGVDPVTPDGTGLIAISGSAVANHLVPVETHTRTLNSFNVEVQYAASNAGALATKSGVAHFDSTAFTVDPATGYVTLAGGAGPAIDSITVDAATGPGTNPVVPNGSGIVVVTGAQVASGAIGTNVIRTDSLAANTYTIEIQRSTAVAATDVTKNGVSHFKSTDFSVDANAFVSLANPYSSGTWTPVVSFGGSSTGITYNTGPTGVYTLIGKLCFFAVGADINSNGTGIGGFSVTLPFTAATTNLPTRCTSVVYGSATSLQVTATYSTGNINSGSTQVSIGGFSNAGFLGTLDDTNITDGSSFQISGSYITA